jgi:VWFA-related protein
MRLAWLTLWTAAILHGQFRSTVPLVVAPTTITDAKGRFIDGLEPGDLRLYDNNVPQKIQLDEEVRPISLVVAIQASLNAAPVLDKLGRSGALFADLLAGEAGETALLTFSNEATLRQDFTSDAAALSRRLKSLTIQGNGVASLDALLRALRMLAARGTSRRHIVLLIAEKRDRSSKSGAAAVLQEAQRQNALIYWLSFSPSLTAYTARAKTVHSVDPKEDGKLEPPPMGPPNLLNVIPELYQLGKPDLSELFARATGARNTGFLRRNGLEEAIQAVGEEVHRQYLISFQPGPSLAGVFHTIRVEVAKRPDLRVRTRAGYWTIE